MDDFLPVEMSAVQQYLTDSLRDLHHPLGELIQGQVREAAPYVRAAFVIAAAYAHDSTERETRHRRWLAAALEMLAVALRIHKLLVARSIYNGNEDDSDLALPVDRSFLGSTILAGDYCFSTAAQMASQTENAVVVSIFAQALQTISESQLRALFNNTFDAHRVEPLLLRFGVHAALQLTQLSDEQRQQVLTISEKLATEMAHGEAPGHVPFHQPLDADLPPAQLFAWQMVAQWLATQPQNGNP